MKKYVLFVAVVLFMVVNVVSAQYHQYAVPLMPAPFFSAPLPHMVGPGIVGGAIMILPEHIRPSTHIYNNEKHHKFQVRSYELYVFEKGRLMPTAIVGGFCSAASAMIHGERHYIKFPGFNVVNPEFQLAPSPLPCWRMDGINP